MKKKYVFNFNLIIDYMNKTKIYVIAVLACLAYIIAFTLILQLILHVDFEDLGVLWKALLLGAPVVVIWTSITRRTKKDRNEPEQGDSKH